MNLVDQKIELTNDERATVKSLDALIKANQLKKNILLYRNVDFDFIDTHFKFYNPLLDNKVIIERMKNTGLNSFKNEGFSSTSAIEKVNVFQNRKFQLEIRAKKGTNAFIPNNIDQESEVILGRNQQFKIIDFQEIKGDRIKIIVETD